jgi:hypothetical protein
MTKDERKARKRARKEQLRRAHPERQVQSWKAHGVEHTALPPKFSKG